MNWDQIERRWAAMTRRVRADWKVERPEVRVDAIRDTKRPEGSLSVLSDRTIKPEPPKRQGTLSE